MHLQAYPREGKNLCLFFQASFTGTTSGTVWATRHLATCHSSPSPLPAASALVTLSGSSQAHPHANAAAAKAASSLSLAPAPGRASLAPAHIRPHDAVPGHLFQAFRHSRSLSATASTPATPHEPRASLHRVERAERAAGPANSPQSLRCLHCGTEAVWRLRERASVCVRPTQSSERN